ncbi:MAG: hypothetical protein N2Z84_00600, partial [Atribacterota bacterium]|nr:hypothetical protein [Atribacterota bacterium]
FKEWYERDLSSRFFLFELRVGRKLFEDWYLPFVVRKLKVQRVVDVTGEEEWKRVVDSLFTPSLFPEAILFVLWEIPEKVILGAKSTLTSTPFFFLFVSQGMDEQKWKGVPCVIVKPDEQVLRKFCSSMAQRFNVFLSRVVEEKLLHFLEIYNLGKGELEYFFSCFAGRKDITGEEIEWFFEREEKVLLFRFLDALGRREQAKTFHYLQMLWRLDFSPSWLITQIARRFRLLLQCYEGEVMTRDVWQGKNLHPFEAEKIITMKEKYSLPEVYRIFTLLRTADRLVKTQSGDSRITLTRIVGEIMS